MYDITRRFPTTILALLEGRLKQEAYAPIWLGGGGSDRPGGFVGMLPQTRVYYDPNELEVDTSASGSTISLLDNLNHIRFWQKPARWFEARITSGSLVVRPGIWWYDNDTCIEYPGETVYPAPTSGSVYLSDDNVLHYDGWVADTIPICIISGSTVADLRPFIDSRVRTHVLATEVAMGEEHSISGVTTGYVMTAMPGNQAAFRPPTGSPSASGSAVAGVPVPRWHTDGPLASGLEEIDGVWEMPTAFTVAHVWMYVKTLGTSGSTIVDVDYSIDGANWNTIFTTQANRPNLVYNDSDHQTTGIPDIKTLGAGNLLRMNIDCVAAGSRCLTVEMVGETQALEPLYNLLPLGILPMGAA
jgi:hypothetical protein